MFYGLLIKMTQPSSVQIQSHPPLSRKDKSTVLLSPTL